MCRKGFVPHFLNMPKEGGDGNARQQRKELRLQRAIQRIDQADHPTEGVHAATDASSRPAVSAQPQHTQQQHIAIVTKSIDRLERQKASSLRLISGYITATDKKENDRRILNQKRIRERHQAKHRYETKCRAMQEEISSGWEDCAAQKSAWDTKEAIKKQQERCEALVRAKEDLIQDFSFYRRLADDDHQSSLVDHTEILDDLKESIASELQEMQQSLEEKLETIEEAFVEDRSKLLESNRDEIANLILEKSNLQLHHMQSNLARRDGNIADIHAKRDDARQDYAKLKASLESQILELEQKLEKAKSSHAMNGSKLDYNLRILGERNEEAAAIIKKQKKKLVQSKAKFNESRDRYWEAEKRADRQISALFKDCKALASRNEGLQTKSRWFEMNDKSKYQELLDMHIEELSVLADKIKRSEGAIASALMGGSNQPEYQTPTGAKIYDGQDDEETQLANLIETIDEGTHQGWIELEAKLEAYKDTLNQRSHKNDAVDRIANDSHGVQRRVEAIAESGRSTELICPPTMFLQATKIG